MFSAIKQAGSGRCLVVGDFNYPSINWDNLECNKEDEEFVDLIQDNVLFQHVRVPTRESNILDLVISNEVSMVDELKVLEQFSTSDHNMVEFNFVLRTGCFNAVTYKYDFRKGDYKAIALALKETDWGLMFEGKGTLQCYEILIDKLNNLMDKYVPKIKVKKQQRCLWLTGRVKKPLEREIKSGNCIKLPKKIRITRNIKSVAIS